MLLSDFTKVFLYIDVYNLSLSKYNWIKIGIPILKIGIVRTHLVYVFCDPLDFVAIFSHEFTQRPLANLRSLLQGQSGFPVYL